MSAEINHICPNCGHTHIEETEGIWEELSDTFVCPVCSTSKEEYSTELWYQV